MNYIAHRGLILGPNKDLENNPNQIQKALDQGFSCEVDLWCIDGKFFLGHDGPEYPVNENFIHNKKFWIHAKNLTALYYLTKQSDLVYFWHQNDDFTLTSNGLIWTYPGKPLSNRSIMVMPEWYTKEFYSLDKTCYGICSDYILDIRNVL